MWYLRPSARLHVSTVNLWSGGLSGGVGKNVLFSVFLDLDEKEY